ncbi:MAG: neutral/alkaline non-lysosomal ceramidase N-terminal domain-containing protein [Draconibacterium sp.]|nr:neutral/alkaline non-lysosomal ceramidase N-terminal domain-containing protein [Draconibacterium sp.]
MRVLKKIGITIGIIIVFLVVLVLFATGPVVETPYFETEYFKKSCAETDSLKNNLVPAKGKLLAGFSKISITPTLYSTADNIEKGEFVQLPLAGFGARKGMPSTGIHDSIFVKAAALKVEDKLVVFVGADLLIMPPNITDSVMVVLSGKGITRDEIYFSATHTHSSLGGWGPGLVGKEFAGEENKILEKWLVKQISKAVIQAVSNIKPAAVASGDFNAGEYTRNRLIGDLGTKNDDFSYFFIQQKEGKKAVIGSFAAHSTCMGSKNMEISGDYPGYWERKMESTSVDYAIFMAGSVGSQTNSGKGEGFEKPRFIGESLADSTINHLRNIVTTDSVLLASATIKLNLPEYHFRITTTRNLSTALTKKLMPVPDNACLQGIRLGNMVWITTPSDFSGEFALQLKNTLAVKGFDGNVTSFNGSYAGYIIPGRYFYLDEYEPKLMGFFGPTMGDYTFDLINQITNILIN